MMVPLKDGKKLQLQVLDHEERFDCPDLAEVKDFIRQPQEPWFPDRANTTLFNRSISEERFPEIGHDYLFLARLDGEAVGSAWYQAPVDSPEVGACAFVFTHPSHRGSGISLELMRYLVSHFMARGGVAMYLGTSNPTARGVYQRAGFRVYNGAVMRRIGTNLDDRAFDDEFFSDVGGTGVRKATWGDLSRLTALYSYPHPWYIKDFGEGVFSHPTLPQQRALTIPISILLRSEESSNALLVMEDSRKRILGALSVYSKDPQNGGFALDFLVLPSKMDALPSLLDAGLQAARELGGRRIEAFLSELDRGKKDALLSLGFSPGRPLTSGILPSGSVVEMREYDAPV
jgi:GNAT superfamily N-acetyltransferase